MTQISIQVLRAKPMLVCALGGADSDTFFGPPEGDRPDRARATVCAGSSKRASILDRLECGRATGHPGSVPDDRVIRV